MRHRAWAWLALTSFHLFSLAAATRPRYGGTLTVELSASCADLAGCDAVLPMIAETLVRLNERGEFEPDLATTWQHDAERKRWRFSLRPKIFFHDGEALTATAAASSLNLSLKKEHPDVAFIAGGQTLLINSPSSIPNLLFELTRSANAIVRNGDKGTLIGTGPFRVAQWEPNHRLSLSAFEDDWAGRPFLDTVIIDFGATGALGDIFDIPFSPARRIMPERTRIWTSRPRELIALVSDRVQPEAWQALAFAIDRKSIVDVLTQKRAEAAFNLLPQWLTGYAFLFASAPDVARARQSVSQLRITPMTLGYPASDAFAKSVAERIALNARDAGIALQPAQTSGANVRLIRWRLESPDPATELRRLAEMLGHPDKARTLDSAKPDSLYQAERALLDAHRVIPIAYLPDVYGISPRIHNWETAQKNNGFRLHLENVWVEP